MEQVLGCSVASVAAAYLVALAVRPLLQGRGKGNLAGTALAVAGIAACPALVPPGEVMARAFSCLLCIDPLFRAVDYARQVRTGRIRPVSWGAYAFFLVPFPFLLTVFGQKRATAPPAIRAADAARLAAALSAFGAAMLLCAASHRWATLRESFLLDHLTKMVLFIVAVESASRVLALGERLAGFETVPIVDRAWLARTPGEFWFRYNQRVRDWLHVNVFVPCGGRRSRAWGVAAAFLVSAIFHEFFFALATSRLDGYQFAFFLMQAPAVILSPGIDRLVSRGRVGRCIARGLTVFWFAGTSPLFFHGLDRVFPFFYASEPWLP
jgi:hypothetical protein